MVAVIEQTWRSDMQAIDSQQVARLIFESALDLANCPLHLSVRGGEQIWLTNTGRFSAATTCGGSMFAHCDEQTSLLSNPQTSPSAAFARAEECAFDQRGIDVPFNECGAGEDLLVDRNGCLDPFDDKLLQRSAHDADRLLARWLVDEQLGHQ